MELSEKVRNLSSADVRHRVRHLFRHPLCRALSWIEKIPAVPLYLLPAIVIFPIVWVLISPPTLTDTLQPSRFHVEEGSTFQVFFPFGFLEITSDSHKAGWRSKLQLFEDGRPLGPAHAAHAEIRENGRGRYSHWIGTLRLATSDNSDPRTNGRVYEVVGPGRPSTWVYFVAFTLLVLAGTRAVQAAHPEKQQKMSRFLGFLFDPLCGYSRTRWVSPTLLLAGAAVGMLSIFIVWRTGVTPGLALAGFLPQSDAAGYLWCANDLLHLDTTLNWCHRRPIYTVFLASLLMILDQDLHLVLLVQAVMLSLAVVIFARDVGRWLGPIYGICAGLAAVLLVKDYALNQVMTEVLGLTLGMLALTVLLRAGERLLPGLALFGLALLSVAMNVRAGAFIVIPLISLWVGLLAWQSGRGVFRYLLMACGAAALGFLIHGLLVEFTGGESGGSHGNFSLTLYGLSVGGDWATVLTDHPEISSVEDSSAFSNIYSLAVSNILQQPQVFLSSLLKNLFHFINSIVLRSVGERFPIFDNGIVWLCGFAVTAWAAKQNVRAALVLAVCAGELASSAVIAGDGGARVFAVTAAAQILPFLVLISFIIRFFGTDTLSPTTIAGSIEPATGRPAMALPKAALACISAIALVFIPSITEFRQLAKPPVLSAEACGSGLYTIMTRLKAGGPSLTITPEARSPEVWPRRINHRDLDQGIASYSWIRSSILSLPAMQILIVRQRFEKDYGSERHIYFPGEGGLPSDRDLVLCADPEKRRIIAERPFWEVVSYREL